MSTQRRLNGAPGELVSGIEELQQSLRIICRTRRRSVPGRPDFGLDLDKFVDAPVSLARAAIVREVTRGVPASDPRIEVLKVTPATPRPDGVMPVEIRWQPAKTTAPQNTLVEVPSGAP